MQMLIRNKRDLKARIKSVLTPLATGDQILELDEVKSLIQDIAEESELATLPLADTAVDAVIFAFLIGFLKQQRASEDIIHRVEKLRLATQKEGDTTSHKEAGEGQSSSQQPAATPTFSFSALKQQLQKKRVELETTTSNEPKAVEEPDSAPPRKLTKTEEPGVVEDALPNEPVAVTTELDLAVESSKTETQGADPHRETIAPKTSAGEGFRIAPMDDEDLYDDIVPANMFSSVPPPPQFGYPVMHSGGPWRGGRYNKPGGGRGGYPMPSPAWKSTGYAYPPPPVGHPGYPPQPHLPPPPPFR